MADWPFLRVAVGVIRNAAGDVLIAKRSSTQHQGGLWEFPGGKIESGESTGAALKRELAEELGIFVGNSRPLIRIPYVYPDRRVCLEVEEVIDYQGEPQGLEDQPLAWCSPERMRAVDFPAANQPIITALQLPLTYVISPDCEDPGRWLQELEACLAAGARLVQMRVTGPMQQREALGREAIQRCHSASARLMINHDFALAERIGADGVHLTAAQLHTGAQAGRPPSGWLSASCHDPQELRLAATLGVDFAVLSPVAATRSHPQAVPLGWETFADWVAEAPMPVYALGGMRPDDIESARAHGGQGVAGISGFWPPLDGAGLV